MFPWWDEIAFLVQNSTQKSLQLENWETSVSLTSANQYYVKEILQRIKTDSSRTMQQKILNLKLSLGLNSGYTPPKKELFMNWEMLREMQDNGMSIGSQSCSHSIMSHLSVEKQRYEAECSKIMLTEKMGKEINTFAYPVGGTSSFTQTTENILMETGYTLAFSFIAGVNRKVNGHQYHLKRFSIDNNCTISQLKKQINKATLKFK